MVHWLWLICVKVFCLGPFVSNHICQNILIWSIHLSEDVHVSLTYVIWSWPYFHGSMTPYKFSYNLHFLSDYQWQNNLIWSSSALLGVHVSLTHVINIKMRDVVWLSMRQSYTKNRQNLNFYRLHNSLQQWTGIHTAKQSVKGPRKIQNVSIFMKYNNRPNLLRQRKTNNNKQAKTSTGLQVPGLWRG